jgi:hypothetical protein
MKKLTIRMEDTAHSALAVSARRAGKSINDYVQNLVTGQINPDASLNTEVPQKLIQMEEAIFAMSQLVGIVTETTEGLKKSVTNLVDILHVVNRDGSLKPEEKETLRQAHNYALFAAEWSNFLSQQQSPELAQEWKKYWSEKSPKLIKKAGNGA